MYNPPPDLSRRQLLGNLLHEVLGFIQTMREFDEEVRTELASSFSTPVETQAKMAEVTDRLAALESKIDAKADGNQQVESGLLQRVEELAALIETQKEQATNPKQAAFWAAAKRRLYDLLLVLGGMTAKALFDELIGSELYPQLRKWVVEPFEPSQVEAQPASPLPSPLPTPTSPIESPLIPRSLEFDSSTANLMAIMQNPHLPARERLEAGLQLDDLGVDPPGLDDFVPIQATAKLGYDFDIGKYPVTNGQFRRFIEAGGYEPKNEARWWSEEVRQHKRKYNWKSPYHWDDARFNRRTQPVVGVNRYEAAAYCAWLTAMQQTSGALAKNEVIRLPTQTEWEAAARSNHGREYPWGSEHFDASCANTSESNLEQTTPVHLYPTGATPDGVWGLSGNVWEWTNDKDKNEWAYLKGGSWYFGADPAKASAADRNDAWYNWSATVFEWWWSPSLVPGSSDF
jgi:hypothetical protein